MVYTTDRRCDAVRRYTWGDIEVVLLHSNDARKHALECARLESEAMQMARDVDNPALESHFARMAKQWLERAARGRRLD